MDIQLSEHTAGHMQEYLTGIVNVIMLNELKINPHDTIPEDGVSINYIDYVISESDSESDSNSKDSSKSEPNPWGTLDRMEDESAMPTMKLKMITKKIEKETHNIKCEPTLDPSAQIQKRISSELFREMLRLSAINKEVMSEHFPTGLDLQLTGDKSKDKRMVISRILTCANMIITGCRRGPATFVILGKEYIDYLSHDVQDDVDFMPYSSLNMFSAGLNIYVSGKLGNTVLVGRYSKDGTESGIHLVTTAKDISGKINVKDNDISDVDVSYMIIANGLHPEKTYLQFNILDHVEK